MKNRLPGLVAHADWSIDARKRWIAIAVRGSDGRFRAQAPEKVDDPLGRLSSLQAQLESDGCLVVGFDFPIGLPLPYAQKCGINSFLKWLPEAGSGHWSQFFQPAYEPGEIQLFRPFYPYKPGGARQAHLFEGLGFTSMNDLRRRCDLAHEGRRAAAPVFWTLGGQQVGKAAICGWRDLLQPVLSGNVGIEPGRVKFWPFSGWFYDLLDSASIIVLETYPAECYNHLGVSFTRRHFVDNMKNRPRTSGKRSQVGRAANAHNIVLRSEELGLDLEPTLKEKIFDGFGPSGTGEDQFDAFIGLIGMLNVLSGNQSLDEPPAGMQREIEGWIFGQKFSDLDPSFYQPSGE